MTKGTLSKTFTISLEAIEKLKTIPDGQKSGFVNELILRAEYKKAEIIISPG